GHLATALLHALVFDVPAQSLGGGAPTLTATVAIGAIGACAAISGRLAGRFRVPLDALALAALAYANFITLEGVALTAALAGQAVGTGALARRDGDPAALYGSLAFVALAAVQAVIAVAPPVPATDVVPVLTALLAVAGAAALVSRAPFADARIAAGLR